MSPVTLNCRDLSTQLAKEKKSPLLGRINEDFYGEVRLYIGELQREYTEAVRKNNTNKIILIGDELTKAKELVMDIHKHRERKILKAASDNVALERIPGYRARKQETKNLLPEERELFRKVAKILTHFQQRLADFDDPAVGSNISVSPGPTRDIVSTPGTDRKEKAAPVGKTDGAPPVGASAGMPGGSGRDIDNKEEAREKEKVKEQKEKEEKKKTEKVEEQKEKKKTEKVKKEKEKEEKKTEKMKKQKEEKDIDSEKKEREKGKREKGKWKNKQEGENVKEKQSDREKPGSKSDKEPAGVIGGGDRETTEKGPGEGEQPGESDDEEETGPPGLRHPRPKEMDEEFRNSFDGAKEYFEKTGKLLVIVREEVPPFLGVDRKSYQLVPNDITALPAINAELLARRGIVEIV